MHGCVCVCVCDMIFSVCQLQEKYLEQYKDLYSIFKYLTKAFNSVNQPGSWAVLSRVSCPDKSVKIVQLFHDGICAQNWLCVIRVHCYLWYRAGMHFTSSPILNILCYATLCSIARLHCRYISHLPHRSVSLLIILANLG